MCYKLGTIEATNTLIKDLYLDLKAKVNKWSKITNQTPQARMGYVGQHLVSVVTGYVGGKSGGRGYDLNINNNEYAEIKTCYRVDQLGKCKECGTAVSSLESYCSNCRSDNIERKDDSKWLITMKTDKDFSEILDPTFYYFVLFEFEDLNSINNKNIYVKIWRINPKNKGFAYAMIDYYLNIRSNSVSKAPFNMWPYSLKFLLCKPELIYYSVIKQDNVIETLVFPDLMGR